MDHGKFNFLESDDSIFAGAIFMSNRETKLECLQRKLFGLPLSKSKFLKQVKAGMILFLFEHEERKLYGVFEATSDGALNIVPDAFRSTGQSYPAQILFERIWMCKPLCEDEFRNAIKENYYSSNKFHFGLYYEQVVKLIHLFHSRKINVNQYKGDGIPNKIIAKFENPTADEVRITEKGTYFKYKSNEYSIEGRRELKRRLAVPQASSDPPMLYKIPATTMSAQHTDAHTGRGPNQVNLRPLSYLENSYSETLDSQRYSNCLSPDRIAFHQFSVGKQPPTTSEMEYKPLPLHSHCYMSNLGNMVAPYLMDGNQMLVDKENQNTCKEYIPSTNQAFEFPDYIPLVEETQQMLVDREDKDSSLENSEYIPTAILNSCIPNTCMEISKYLTSADGFSNDDDDDKLKTYQRMETDEYNAVGGKFYADSESSRTSVFSRISRRQKISNDETSEPSGSEPSRGLSLDEFLNILSSRRDYWSSMEVSKQSVEWDGNERYQSISSAGLFDRSNGQNKITQLPIEPVKMSGIDDTQHVGFTASFDDNSSNDVLDEESFEIPFYNFRRRNMSQKHETQDDYNKYDDTCGSDAELMRNKRRRIVRPSLYEEMEQNAKIEAEVKKFAQKKAETEVEISARASLDSKNETKVSFIDRFLDIAAPLHTIRKYEPVGESYEQMHVTSMEESLDYIPIE